MFCDLSLESFDAVVVGADAGGDDDDGDAVDTVTDGAAYTVDVDDDDFDGADDNDADGNCEINDVVISDDVTDENGVIVLDDDNSDDDAGVVCNSEVSA